MSHGLKTDLPRLLSRRMALATVAAVAAGPALGACVPSSPETAGPFPSDGTNAIGGSVSNVLTQAGVQREDLRTSFAGLTPVAEGVELALTLQLVATGNACQPLGGAAIYLWACDAAGRYSLYEDADRNYLRGVAVANEQGTAQCTMILPGCYRGRWPHIHFEVFESAQSAVSGRAALVTSQFIIAAEDCAEIYDTHPAYAESRSAFRRLSFDRDRIFADNSEEQNAQQTLEISAGSGAALTGTVVVGVG